jgi:hypothetical protein
LNGASGGTEYLPAHTPRGRPKLPQLARVAYQVFLFAEEEHAERFMKEFGGERMHPSGGLRSCYAALTLAPNLYRSDFRQHAVEQKVRCEWIDHDERGGFNSPANHPKASDFIGSTGTEAFSVR